MYDQNEAVERGETTYDRPKVVREGLGDQLAVAIERHRKELHGLSERLRYVTSQSPESDAAEERSHMGYSPLAEAVVAIQEMTEFVVRLGQRIEL